jgi:hypothetical protein
LIQKTKYIFLLLLLILLFPEVSFPQNGIKDTSAVIDTAGFVDIDPDLADKINGIEGKIIKSISIRVLDIAGSSINSSDSENVSWIGKIGNSLHFKTREWVVNNHLLFKVGDTLRIKKLLDTERLLRENEFFSDARILASSSPDNPDSVDISVLAHDRWTLALQVSYSAEYKAGYFGITDGNLLGFGHSVDALGSYDQDPLIGWGGKLHYKAFNIAGSYINADAILEGDKSNKNRAFGFSRSFITTETIWAGGLEISWNAGNVIYIREGTLTTTPFSNASQDVWLGRSFPVWFGPDIFREKSNIIFAGRIAHKDFSERPLVTPISNRLFENSTLYLLSAGLVNQRYYRDNYIDKFGTTEDVLIGGLVTFTGGREVRELQDRWYGGINGVISRRIQNLGYLSLKLDWGGFRKINRWEQNVFNLDFIFHSPLFRSERWRYRVFFHSSFLLGYNRFEGEQLFLDTESGLRGIPRFALPGTKRITLNFETRIFSPWEVLGFVVGGIVFTDFGLVTNRTIKISDTKLYQGYGFGLRTRNESIAGAQFEFSVVYNPVLPLNYSNNISFIFKGSFVIGSRSFGFNKPSVISF